MSVGWAAWPVEEMTNLGLDCWLEEGVGVVVVVVVEVEVEVKVEEGGRVEGRVL